jgi:hypothetical protein
MKIIAFDKFKSGVTSAADHHFRQAVDWAGQQGALSWELRAATSLAHLLRNQSRLADAIAYLQPIYDRFTEGFDTADLIVDRAPAGRPRHRSRVFVPGLASEARGTTIVGRRVPRPAGSSAPGCSVSADPRRRSSNR